MTPRSSWRSCSLPSGRRTACSRAARRRCWTCAASLADRDAALGEVNAALTARDQFVSVASHKLRTALTAIKGEIQLARRYAARAAAPPTVDMHMQRQEFPPGSSPA